MKQDLIFIIISIIIFFSSTVNCTTEQQCKNLSNTDCKTCLNVNSCAFCSNNKICFLYDPSNVLNTPCNIADMQWQTCVGSFRVWIIIVSVLGGVLLIAIFIVVCCVCRKCKQRRIRKEERRQAGDEQRMEERRAAAEVRSMERNRVADQIRMKYGILKEKDNGTDYSRMN